MQFVKEKVSVLFVYCKIINVDVECCLNCNFRFVRYPVVGDCRLFEKLSEVQETHVAIKALI